VAVNLCTGKCIEQFVSVEKGSAILISDIMPINEEYFEYPEKVVKAVSEGFECLEKESGKMPTYFNNKTLNLAKKMGVTRAVDVSKEKIEDVMKELDMKEGFDVGLEMSGSPVALNSMISVMFHGGKIALLGLLPSMAGIDWDKVIFSGLHLKGIYGREMFETWYKMQAMTQSGLDVSPIITHHFPYKDFKEGFELMALVGQSSTSSVSLTSAFVITGRHLNIPGTLTVVTSGMYCLPWWYSILRLFNIISNLKI